MYPYRKNLEYKASNRIVPFAGPFLLGALTGGVAVSAFNPYRPRPNNYNVPYPQTFYNYGYGGYFPY